LQSYQNHLWMVNFWRKALFQNTATFKAVSLFANTLDECISDMAGDIHVHCQHKEHIKSCGIFNFRLWEYRHYKYCPVLCFHSRCHWRLSNSTGTLLSGPCKKRVVIQFFLELVTFFSSMNCIGEKVVWYAMMGHSVCVVKRMIMQQN
jgi:hypothetical protein